MVRVRTLIHVALVPLGIVSFWGFRLTIGRLQPVSMHSDIVTIAQRRNDATIIVTSNLVPSHPSLELINKTIDSLKFIQALPEHTPMIITIDGAYPSKRKSTATKNVILNEYIKNLREAYNETHVTILPQSVNIRLVGNVREAMQLVDTEFVYVIQHDMPFTSPIDHMSMMQTFDDYPYEVRLVRFSPRKTLTRNRDKGKCGDKIYQQANGIGLSKTHTWSDNNHFTRKSYYDDMFSNIDGWKDVRYMETIMEPLAATNCSYWGTYLYGNEGDPATIVHLDGRHTADVSAHMLRKQRSSRRG